MYKSIKHVFLFASISFFIIFLIIAFSPKSSQQINPKYLQAQTTETEVSHPLFV